MKIKDWLLQHYIKNYELSIEKLKELGAPQAVIDARRKTLEKLRQGKGLGISSIDNNTKEDLFEVSVESVKLVTKPRGKNEFVVFNDNIWLLSGRGFKYLRKDNSDYKLVKELVEVK